MLRFDVGEDLLHYCCNVDRVTVYATAPVNVAVGSRILRQIAAGAGDGGQEALWVLTAVAPPMSTLSLKLFGDLLESRCRVKDCDYATDSVMAE